MNTKQVIYTNLTKRFLETNFLVNELEANLRDILRTKPCNKKTRKYLRKLLTKDIANIQKNNDLSHFLLCSLPLHEHIFTK